MRLQILGQAGSSVRRTVHHDSVEADIHVAAAAALLNTTFFDYVHRKRGAVLSRVGPAGYSVPDRLASMILLVEGISSLPELGQGGQAAKLSSV